MAKKQDPESGKPQIDKPPRKLLKQADAPRLPLEQALRVPRAILDNYAGEPSTPLRAAFAMDMEPNSGPFRELCSAALAYGLTTAGAKADSIGIEPLARRILRPTAEGDDRIARRESFLKPRLIGEFLRKYNGSPVPRDGIARNVLIEMGVPEERVDEVLPLLVEGAKSEGLAHEHKGKLYVDVSATAPPDDGRGEEGEEAELTGDAAEGAQASGVTAPNASVMGNGKPAAGEALGATVSASSTRARRVFVTHGKNTGFVQPIKELLRFGELEPVVSVENQSVSQPVPDKVMADMRTCGAAIIHVDAERKLPDSEAKEHVVLNPNVLIEIGAALALYGRRFILLVKEGVTLPSNLQGLYEVRYDGDALDGNATIKLLKAINDIKNHPLPS